MISKWQRQKLNSDLPHSKTLRILNHYSTPPYNYYHLLLLLSTLLCASNMAGAWQPCKNHNNFASNLIYIWGSWGLAIILIILYLPPRSLLCPPCHPGEAGPYTASPELPCSWLPLRLGDDSRKPEFGKRERWLFLLCCLHDYRS